MSGLGWVKQVCPTVGLGSWDAGRSRIWLEDAGTARSRRPACRLPHALGLSLRCSRLGEVGSAQAIAFLGVRAVRTLDFADPRSQMTERPTEPGNSGDGLNGRGSDFDHVMASASVSGAGDPCHHQASDQVRPCRFGRRGGVMGASAARRRAGGGRPGDEAGGAPNWRRCGG